MNTAKIIPHSNLSGEVVTFPNKQNGSGMEQQQARPDPMVADDVDLRDFAYMPLDVVRFRDSDFAALIDAEGFRAGVLLWCAAWHQVPCGSLPNDDRVLANLAGYGRSVVEWEKVKEAALHGWVVCSNNRLYHPVVAEKANESWAAKQQHRHTRLVDRIRKANKVAEAKGQPPVITPTLEQWLSAGCPKEWKENSNGNPQEFQRKSSGNNKSSNGNPQNSENFPQNSALKVSVSEGKGLINNTERDENSNFENSDDSWKPNLNHLESVIRTTKFSHRTPEILSMPDFEFHLGNFNAHHETHCLTDNQRLRKFAEWILDKFERAEAKTKRAQSSEKPSQQPGRRNFMESAGVINHE